MNALRAALRFPGRVLSWILIGLVRIYQMLISPMIGSHCRYQPTCSEYFIQAVRKYGPLTGAWKGGLPDSPLPSLASGGDRSAVGDRHAAQQSFWLDPADRHL